MTFMCARVWTPYIGDGHLVIPSLLGNLDTAEKKTLASGW